MKTSQELKSEVDQTIGLSFNFSEIIWYGETRSCETTCHPSPQICLTRFLIILYNLDFVPNRGDVYSVSSSILCVWDKFLLMGKGRSCSGPWFPFPYFLYLGQISVPGLEACVGYLSLLTSPPRSLVGQNRMLIWEKGRSRVEQALSFISGSRLQMQGDLP